MAIAGMLLCIVGLVFSFSIFTPLYIFSIGLAVACTATGLTLSGIAFYRALEDDGTPPGVLIARLGLASGVAAIMVLVAWIAYAIATVPTTWS